MDIQTELQAVLKDEARCKCNKTCSRLKVRELYFEPNADTLGEWQKRYGFFKTGLDRRIVFVAESPSDRRDRKAPADFIVNGQKGWRCWDNTTQDKRFREFRIKHGFQNCLVTNAVKCGVPKPSTPAFLTTREARACSSFLCRELEVVRPTVVACLGNSALHIFMEYTLPFLTFTPVSILLTHYSFRGSLKKLKQSWGLQAEMINVALKSRNTAKISPI